MEHRPPHDHAVLVDVLRDDQEIGESRAHQPVEILHDAILPQERAVHRAARDTDDLVAGIDAEALAVGVAGKRAKILDAGGFRPQKRVGVEIDSDHAARVRKSHDVARVIDVHRRVPGVAAQVADVDDDVVLPQHRVARGELADRDIAVAGNTDNLAPIVDPRRGRGGITGQRPQLVHRALLRVPHDRAELELLRRVARRIEHRRLGPTDHLPGAVNAGRKSLIAAQRGQGFHHAVLPDGADADVACHARQKGSAAPFFVQRVERGGLADAGDDAVVADAGPLHDAVRPAERPQCVEHCAVPERGDARRVAGPVHEACDQAAIADAGCTVARAAKRRQVGDGVARFG